MEERYLRNIPALTEAEQLLLRRKRVLIAGCGGIGGHLVDLLLRVGVGHIRVVDGDVFEASNLNRQLLSGLPQLGQSKAQAAEYHGVRVNPDVVVEAHGVYMTEDNANALVDGCDVVLDALDNIESRRILSAACGRAGIPYIFGAVCGWTAQAAISMPGDHLINILYPEDVVRKDKSVLSFTPALCASLQASLCVKLLAGRPVDTGKLYHFDLLEMEFETFPLTQA